VKRKKQSEERGIFPLSNSLKTRNWNFSRLQGRLAPYAFLSPALIVITLFFFIPLVMVFILSFTNLDMTNFGILEWWRPANWSLDNYVKIFTNRFFPKILGNTLIYVALTLAFFNVGMALIIALITTHISRGAGFAFRALWLLPRITPVVVYIMMWKALAGPAPMGIINNYLLGPLGIGRGEYLLNTSPWVFVILVNGFEDWIWHAQGLSERSVGIEISGNFPGLMGNNRTLWRGGGGPHTLTRGQVTGLLKAYDFIADETERLDIKIQHVLAHRQSKDTRTADPGEEIWRKIGQIWQGLLVADDGGDSYSVGSGRPIPREWDSRRTSRYWSK